MWAHAIHLWPYLTMQEKLKWNEAVNEKALIDGCLLSDICDRSD